MRGYFTGAGDFFSAMVLGHYQKDEHLEESLALTKAVNNAIRTTHALLRKTARASAVVSGASEYGYTDEELDAKDEDRRPRRMRARELRVIGSNDIILSAGEVVANDCPALRDLQSWEEFWEG
jgi:pyridoxine kinase